MKVNAVQRGKAEGLVGSNQPPLCSRYWGMHLPHPCGDEMGPALASTSVATDAEVDAWVASLPWPSGWIVTETVQCSRPRRGRPTRGRIHPDDARVVRVRLEHRDRPRCRWAEQSLHERRVFRLR